MMIFVILVTLFTVRVRGRSEDVQSGPILRADKTIQSLRRHLITNNYDYDYSSDSNDDVTPRCDRTSTIQKQYDSIYRRYHADSNMTNSNKTGNEIATHEHQNLIKSNEPNNEMISQVHQNEPMKSNEPNNEMISQRHQNESMKSNEVSDEATQETQNELTKSNELDDEITHEPQHELMESKESSDEIITQEPQSEKFYTIDTSLEIANDSHVDIARNTTASASTVKSKKYQILFKEHTSDTEKENNNGTEVEEIVDERNPHEEITPKARYKLIKLRSESGRRSMPRRLLEEQGERHMAIMALDRGPVPDFILPRHRRQYMSGSD